MIVVRDVFQIEPDQMKLAKELVKQGREMGRRLAHPFSRILTDLTGEYYTLVLESEAKSLAEYEAGLQKVMADAEWQRFYPQFRKLIRGGRREIFSVVE